MNATVDANRKGELALQLVDVSAVFKRRPTITADAVATWEEITSEVRSGAAGAISNVGQAVARAALRGMAGKAATAAVGSAVDSATGAPHTVRVDWGRRTPVPDMATGHALPAACDSAQGLPAPNRDPSGADTRSPPRG